jgi:two-component system nitrate/nitrite sensor histidine kinase NarX
MLARHPLTVKLAVVGSAVLVLALASIGLTLWVTWQLEGGAAAVNEAGRMRMQTWRLASVAKGGAPLAEVPRLVAQFDKGLKELRAGDPQRPLFVPWNDNVAERFAAVESVWGNLRQFWLLQPEKNSIRIDASAAEFVGAIDLLVLAIEQQLARLTAILNLFQFLMMALAVGSAVAMLYTSYLYVISPLGRLQMGLRRLEEGDFATRIDVDTADEFGAVAAGFNRMAHTLQTMYARLEALVKAKTLRIEAQHARLESLYEVSAFLARTTSLEELSRGFAQRLRRVSGADAVTIRWVDAAQGRYVLLATDCFPAEIAEAEHSLRAGTCACGGAPADTRTRVIPIHASEPTAAHRCAKEGFQHMVRVPVRLHERALGECNLFFRGNVTLNTEEMELLDVMASHLAVALEGLRAFALEREAAVSEERAMLARELHDSIAQSLSFLKIQAQLLRAAVQKGQAEQTTQWLGELDNGLRDAVNDVRELLVHFRTRANEEDIEPALQETLQKFKHQSGLAAQLNVYGAGLPLAPDVQVQVLHIVQEALSNVRKHAGASRATIDVHKGPRWRIVVHDDGQGFDRSKALDSSHVGLNIMRERAERIGAKVTIASTPGDGTAMTLQLTEHPVASNALQPAPHPPSELVA